MNKYTASKSVKFLLSLICLLKTLSKLGRCVPYLQTIIVLITLFDLVSNAKSNKNYNNEDYTHYEEAFQGA